MVALFPIENERCAHVVHDAMEVVRCLSLTSRVMAKILRTHLSAVAVFTTLFSSAQGGIRLIIWNYEPVFAGYGDLTHFGLGYDKDLNEFVSMGVELRYGIESESWVANYHSAYHFSDNTSGSFYLGPTVGVRQIPSDDPKLLFPLGFRIGVRGGLERFYADIHAGYHYNLGAGEAVTLADRSGVYDLRTGSFCAGLDLGWGWDDRSRRDR